MTYAEWEKSVPTTITADPVWSMESYRLALFVGDIAWRDVTRLMQDARTIKIAGQLYQAAGSISSNITEGYSRSSRKDQARFFEYSLGSARESRDWYFKGRFVLGESIVATRYKLLASIAKLLLSTLSRQRDFTAREEPAEYGGVPPDILQLDFPFADE